MEIGNIEAALGKVRAFIAQLDRSWGIYEATSTMALPEWRELDAQIQEQLPLIVRIAERADPEIPAKLKLRSKPWPYSEARRAARQLAGTLATADEAEQILAPVGPKLAAKNLHAWIWNAAVSLWDDGHRRESVQAAAAALFDQHLPAKLGIPPKPSTKELVAQAFSTDPPTAGNPRLRLDDYPDPSPSWTSQHEGARFLGMGCAQLIRNLVTHNAAQPDEQIALEQLATLSMLARLIERAKVITL